MFKTIKKNMGYKTYETLYNSYVDPILNYSAGVWGFDNFNGPQILQNQVLRFFLGVHKFAPLPSVRLEMDWLECRERRWIEMLRLFNRINNMDASRLPKLVLVWDASLELNSWFFEIQQIAASLNLDIHPDSDEIYYLNAAHDKLIQIRSN